MKESTVPPKRERSLLEAYFHGLSMLALLIAGTVGFVLLILWVCGAPPSLGPCACVAALLLGAVILRVYSRLGRDPR